MIAAVLFLMGVVGPALAGATAASATMGKATAVGGMAKRMYANWGNEEVRWIECESGVGAWLTKEQMGGLWLALRGHGEEEEQKLFLEYAREARLSRR